MNNLIRDTNFRSIFRVAEPNLLLEDARRDDSPRNRDIHIVLTFAIFVCCVRLLCIIICIYMCVY